MVYCEMSKDLLITKLPKFNYMGEGDSRLNVVIAGGAVRDSLFGDQFSDIDIFGLTEQELDKFVEQNLSSKNGYRQVYFNKNLRTYKKGKVKVQVIYREYESLNEILDKFDFTVCQFMYDGEKIICNPQSILDVNHKRIVINHLDPLFVFDSLRRVQKYIQKGYSICNGGIKCILDKCRELTQEQYDENVEFYPNTEEYRIIRFD